MKNHFEISVLKKGEELPGEYIVEDIENADGIKVMGIVEDEKIIPAAYMFDKRKYTQHTAEQWVKDRQEFEAMKPVKSYDCELKNFNDEKLSFDATASTSEVDRDGDILRASGWILKRFKQNPIMLWSHNSMMLPVGRAENVRKDGDSLTFTPVFTPKDINPLGEQIYNMYKAKFLNAFSVRFDPFEWKEREAPEGKGANERYGKEYTKLELLEISPVTIPANASALINRDFRDMMFKEMLLEKSVTIKDPTIKEKLLEGIIHPAKSETKPGFEETENEVRYRVREPGAFQEGSFRRITLQATKPRVFAIIGKLTGETKTTIQAVRFPKDDGWTIPKAKTWVKDHPEIKKDYSDEELKELEVTEEKSGRVLSAKNRTLVNTAMEAMGKTTGALQALLEAAEPQAGVDTDDELSKLKEDLDKIGDEEGVERIIHDGDKILKEIEGGK